MDSSFNYIKFDEDTEEDCYGIGSYKDMFTLPPLSTPITSSSLDLFLHSMSSSSLSNVLLSCEHIICRYHGKPMNGFGTLKIMHDTLIWIPMANASVALSDISNKDNNNIKDQKPLKMEDKSSLCFQRKDITNVSKTIVQGHIASLHIEIHAHIFEFLFMPGPHYHVDNIDHFVKALTSSREKAIKVTKMDKHRSMIHAYLAIKDDTTDKYQLATTINTEFKYPIGVESSNEPSFKIDLSFRETLSASLIALGKVMKANSVSEIKRREEYTKVRCVIDEDGLNSFYELENEKVIAPEEYERRYFAYLNETPLHPVREEDEGRQEPGDDGVMDNQSELKENQVTIEEDEEVSKEEVTIKEDDEEAASSDDNVVVVESKQEESVVSPQDAVQLLAPTIVEENDDEFTLPHVFHTLPCQAQAQDIITAFNQTVAKKEEDLWDTWETLLQVHLHTVSDLKSVLMDQLDDMTRNCAREKAMQEKKKENVKRSRRQSIVHPCMDEFSSDDEKMEEQKEKKLRTGKADRRRSLVLPLATENEMDMQVEYSRNVLENSKNRMENSEDSIGSSQVSLRPADDLSESEKVAARKKKAARRKSLILPSPDEYLFHDEEKEDEKEEETMCKICCSDQVAIELQPCGHCICRNCWIRLMGDSDSVFCPWDRMQVESSTLCDQKC